MRKYDSTLNVVIQEVYLCKDAEQAKKILLDHLETSKIDKLDKKKMELDIKALNHINAVYKYATNAMFRFEGLSVNSYK